ncbi:hypothetical protein [Chamaesiphon sp. OTE_75_metabat_556]|nr:hypothetical protein [Chamaesiphon sp. OTE_75_metabat_556]
MGTQKSALTIGQRYLRDRTIHRKLEKHDRLNRRETTPVMEPPD